MSGRSPIDSLRQLAPVSDADAAAVFGIAGGEDLLTGVTQQPVGRPRDVRRAARRPRKLVLALAVVAAAATAAAAWAFLGSSAKETTSVECVIAGTDTVIPASSGDPARDCAIEWKRELGKAAPPLAAYDNGHGGVTVLPRREAPPVGFKRLVGTQDVALIELQDSLDDYVNGLNSGCLDTAAASSLTQARLAQFGFTGWTVGLRSGDSGIGRTCWNGDIVDPSSQSVTLLPTGVPAGLPEQAPQKLAAKLRPLTRQCESLPAAVSSVRAAASSLGLSKSARGYDLNTAPDDSLRCASIYETVGGTIFLTVRGPRS